jgi:uncharacterized protein
MGWRTKYDVEFRGLKEGLHEFEFEIQDSFFEHFEQAMVNKGDVHVKVKLEKRSSFLKLYIIIKGWLELTCDRCLELYKQDIKQKSELYVKFGENVYEDDEVIWISPDEHKLNLAQLIYEYIVLSMPMKHVHPDNKKGENGCDKEMLEKIEKLRSQEEEKKEADPRWEALKNWNKN